MRHSLRLRQDDEEASSPRDRLRVKCWRLPAAAGRLLFRHRAPSSPPPCPAAAHRVDARGRCARAGPFVRIFVAISRRGRIIVLGSPQHHRRQGDPRSDGGDRMQICLSSLQAVRMSARAGLGARSFADIYAIGQRCGAERNDLAHSTPLQTMVESAARWRGRLASAHPWACRSMGRGGGRGALVIFRAALLSRPWQSFIPSSI